MDFNGIHVSIGLLAPGDNLVGSYPFYPCPRPFFPPLLPIFQSLHPNLSPLPKNFPPRSHLRLTAPGPDRQRQPRKQVRKWSLISQLNSTQITETAQYGYTLLVVGRGPHATAMGGIIYCAPNWPFRDLLVIGSRQACIHWPLHTASNRWGPLVPKRATVVSGTSLLSPPSIPLVHVHFRVIDVASPEFPPPPPSLVLFVRRVVTCHVATRVVRQRSRKAAMLHLSGRLACRSAPDLAALTPSSPVGPLIVTLAL